jgi:hypothetical protein
VELITPEQLKALQSAAEKIRDPIKLRITTLVVLALVIFGIDSYYTDILTRQARGYVERFNKKEILSDLILVKAARDRLQPLLPPKEADLAWWLGRFRRIAAEYGVGLRGLSYNPNGSVGGLPVLDISYSFEGALHKTLSLVAWLESSRPTIRVVSVTMNPLPAKGQVSMSTALKVLFTGEGK